MQAAPGVELSGHLISAEIGAGGASRVFLASTPGGRPVAIKVADGPAHAALLRHEAELLGRVAGPRFVRVLEEHLDHDPPHLVLEALPTDLRRALTGAPGRRLPPDEVARLAWALLEGLAVAHSIGLVHGDLKPENVLLDERGDPRLADLGLATQVEVDGVRGSLPSRREVAGTLDYLAPELRRGEPPSAASDLFALGVLLHEALTGERPGGLLEPPAARLARQGVTVPAALDRVVVRALAADPAARYPDARAMLDDLRALGPAAPARVRAHGAPLLDRTLADMGDELAAALITGLAPGLPALCLLFDPERRRWPQALLVVLAVAASLPLCARAWGAVERRRLRFDARAAAREESP